MLSKGKAKASMKKAIGAQEYDEINRLILEYPFLIEEFKELQKYPSLDIEGAIIAATGVMEDELAGPVKVEDIVKSAIQDFRKNITEIEVFSILDKIERQGFIQKRGIGWVLTARGSELCDQTLAEIGY
ncbi:MAG: hypothetical protein EAX96_03020 [Candidatus Lokiarchaeota archaeon]|nr:hypothetical protein [Candidatus Lokiarchaeota archaeon]